MCIRARGNIGRAPYRPSPAVRRVLRRLGADIREARLRRDLSMEIVAERAATPRATLTRVEMGDPAVSAGILAVSDTQLTLPTSYHP